MVARVKLTTTATMIRAIIPGHVAQQAEGKAHDKKRALGYE
jgi:hypothetical protein